jgi:hypothetical protein
VDTDVYAPDDGLWYHPKHIEQFPDKIYCVTFYFVGYILEYHIKDLTSLTRNYSNQKYGIQYLSSHFFSVDFAAVPLTCLTAVERQPCSLQRADVITKLLRNEITIRRSLKSCKSLYLASCYLALEQLSTKNNNSGNYFFRCAIPVVSVCARVCIIYTGRNGF